MQLVQKRVFLTWALQHGIKRDLKYRDFQPLIYPGAADYNRFWLPDTIVPNLINFVNAVLHTASPTGPFYFYRPGRGTWHYGMEELVRNQIIDRIIAYLNIPNDFRGALKLESNEWSDILTIITVHYVFAWSNEEDLHIIPDSGDCILMVSHHGSLDGAFPSERRLMEFISAMDAKGFPLPKHVPDETYKIPPWMY